MQMAIFPHGIYKYSVEDTDQVCDRMMAIYNEGRFLPENNVTTSSSKFFRTFDDIPGFDLISNSYHDIIKQFFKEAGLDGGLVIDGVGLDVYERNSFRGRYTSLPWQWTLCHYILHDPKIHSGLCFHNPSQVILESNYPTGFTEQTNQYWYTEYCPIVEQGELLIFPSYLETSVPLNDSNQIKATVSFNFRIVPNADRDSDTEESSAQ
jgi:hypothetical protein